MRHEENCSITLKATNPQLSVMQQNACSMSDVGGTIRVFDSQQQSERLADFSAKPTTRLCIRYDKEQVMPPEVTHIISFLHQGFMLWKNTSMVSICQVILNSYLSTAAFFYRNTVQKVKTSPHRLASNITLLWEVHPLSVFCLTVDCIMKCYT